MKHRCKYYAMLLVAFPLVLATGCKSGGKKAPGLIDDGEAGQILQRIEALKQVYHLCPSPAEMLSVMDVADLSFDGGLPNPVESSDRYLDTKSATLALGIYASDLAYTALFGRHEETLDYLEALRSVGERIRVTGAVNDELIRKARANVDDLDSLFSISNEAFINLMFFCERNNRPNTIAIMSAGAFVESLYLAVNLVDEYDDAGYILQHLMDQKYALENLVLFFGSLQGEDENVTSVMEEMDPIIRLYDSFEAGKGGVTVTAEPETGGGQPKKLVIGREGTPPTLSPGEFDKLKQETIRLRARMVEG